MVYSEIIDHDLYAARKAKSNFFACFAIALFAGFTYAKFPTEIEWPEAQILIYSVIMVVLALFFIASLFGLGGAILEFVRLRSPWELTVASGQIRIVTPDNDKWPGREIDLCNVVRIRLDIVDSDSEEESWTLELMDGSAVKLNEDYPFSYEKLAKALEKYFDWITFISCYDEPADNSFSPEHPTKDHKSNKIINEHLGLRWGRGKYFISCFALIYGLLILGGLLSLSGIEVPEVVGWIILSAPLMYFSSFRFRDLNLPGWLAFIMGIPKLNLILCVILSLFSGSPGSNKYGYPG